MTPAPARRPPPTPAFLTCTETSALARAISLRTSVEMSCVADATSWPSVPPCRVDVRDAVVILVRGLSGLDEPVVPIAHSQHDGGEKSRDDAPAQDGEL